MDAVGPRRPAEKFLTTKEGLHRLTDDQACEADVWARLAGAAARERTATALERIAEALSASTSPGLPTKNTDRPERVGG
ncbi:hypothetical protein [Streptomyces venezuelae]|uniref:hypothetical protein n=1 Tax=Streptomyces venezuelae TaxID=54571 RepID=UPI00342B88BB